ncbi:B12-binding domain-containing radical SAM protein [Candidatus Aerophobetes bacterium]|uniref:B12-binding domain-containing radical SAM protein n=1 Tax=Aerophobetes bacterium TaxID=2030807 RepID=A0A662CY12_UNCAE|nr:MAG: B12-binding domain-containing radical SAM protein [Candidatus Aerophobetes bacterium]
MKILLISPTWKKKVANERLKRDRIFKFPPHSLLAVAALTPKDIEVGIIDENIEELDFNRKADLVGITTMTASSPRAYEIADEFRRKGIPVVIGGIHATALPEEAAQHADAVVIGEAEGCWERLLEDFKRKGKKGLAQFYRNFQLPDPSKIPIARRELLEGKGYLLSRFLQISRGCPFNCSFCSVSRFFGKKYRFRPVKNVIEEVKSIVGKSLKTRFLGFLDDNIVGSVSYAKELFKALIPYRVLWAGQSSINIARDDELLDLAARSGCKGLFIGFESVSEDSLGEANKLQNKIGFYEKAVKKIHQFGISIEGAFIFGFDHDDKSIFQRTVKFIERVKLDAVQFTVLTPLPGTKLYEKLEEEGRITDKDWSNYDFTHVVFRPKLMTPEELRQGLTWAYQRIYSLPSIFRRLTGSFSGGRWRYSGPILALNLAYRRTFKGAEA